MKRRKIKRGRKERLPWRKEGEDMKGRKTRSKGGRRGRKKEGLHRREVTRREGMIQGRRVYIAGKGRESVLPSPALTYILHRPKVHLLSLAYLCQVLSQLAWPRLISGYPHWAHKPSYLTPTTQLMLLTLLAQSDLKLTH